MPRTGSAGHLHSLLPGPDPANPLRDAHLPEGNCLLEPTSRVGQEDHEADALLMLELGANRVRPVCPNVSDEPGRTQGGA